VQHQSIRVVRIGQFGFVTAQTPGSQCLAAVHPEARIDSPMLGGVFSVAPAARTTVRHHGARHTIADVLNRSSYVRWGEQIITQTPSANGLFDAC
jgi:uncharacterized RmlC-like cupin family protein